MLVMTLRFGFRHNLWNGDPMNERYANLFLISRNREARVSDHIKFRNDCFYWNPILIRALHDWKVESMAQLLEDLYAIQFRHGEVDKLEWLPLKTKTAN